MLNGTLIGTVAVITGELGYMVDPAHWGQGYASEACQIAIARAFALGRDHLTAGVWSDNAGSLHVLKKLGFKVAGQDVTLSVARKSEATGHLLRLDRADWKSGNAGDA